MPSRSFRQSRTETTNLQQQLQAAQTETAGLQQQLTGLNTAKAEVDQKVLASETRVAELSGLAGLETQLAGWQKELAEVLPGQEQAPEGAGGKDPAGLVAASIASVVALTRNKDSQLQQSTAELLALHEQFGALGAEKARLESSLEEKTRAVAELQAQLDAAAANKLDAERRLEAEVA